MSINAKFNSWISCLRSSSWLARFVFALGACSGNTVLRTFGKIIQSELDDCHIIHNSLFWQRCAFYSVILVVYHLCHISGSSSVCCFEVSCSGLRSSVFKSCSSIRDWAREFHFLGHEILCHQVRGCQWYPALSLFMLGILTKAQSCLVKGIAGRFDSDDDCVEV